MEEKNQRLEECRLIAQEAHRQLFCSVSKDVYFSWGVSRVSYGYYNGMPTLILQVSGLLHKGWVCVSLNEGKDVYEVRLLNNERNRIVKEVLEVYFDTLGSTIDSLIERPAGMSDEEYHKQAMADSKAKMDAEQPNDEQHG